MGRDFKNAYEKKYNMDLVIKKTFYNWKKPYNYGYIINDLSGA